jgi:hypothetical protein
VSAWYDEDGQADEWQDDDVDEFSELLMGNVTNEMPEPQANPLILMSKHPNYGLRKPLNIHNSRVIHAPAELHCARTLNRVSDIGNINLFGHSTVAADRVDDLSAVADLNTVVIANKPTPIGKVLADNKISEFVEHANTSKYVPMHCDMSNVEEAKAALTKRLVGDTQTFSIQQSRSAGINGDAYGQYVIGNKGTRPKKNIVIKGKGKTKGRGRGGKG